MKGDPTDGPCLFCDERVLHWRLDDGRLKMQHGENPEHVRIFQYVEDVATDETGNGIWNWECSIHGFDADSEARAMLDSIDDVFPGYAR